MSAATTLIAASNAAYLPDETPECWLCHEEGPDASGKPLVRDCSCRGSTGFAHLSCIVGYAEYQGRKALMVDNCADSFTKAFDFCSNCEQDYQGLVEYQLKKAAVDFVEKEDGLKYPDLSVHVMKNRLTVLDVANEEDKQEGEELCSKIVSIIDDLKLDNDNWYVKDGLVYMEASAYGAIGRFCMRVNTEKSLKRAISALEKGCDLFRLMGDKISVLVAEEVLKEVEAQISGVTHHHGPALSSARKYYEYCVQNYGASNLYTIAAGRSFAFSLYSSGRTIEAERLLHSLLDTSRLTHGHDHVDTATTAFCLEAVRERKVLLRSTDEVFIALRYEDDRKSCVLRGPLTHAERMGNEGQVFTVASSDITLHDRLATPVVCHGLIQRAHLNGKIGDATEVDRDNRVCKICFEEAGLEPEEISYDNFHILFGLHPL
mmetsp:Transcript_24983/g.38322  ORF Transcript_24983/g.38322 Transcript_24983/m.38322 type:complete len:432 (+) Transcript_24983:76-1371(+)